MESMGNLDFWIIVERYVKYECFKNLPITGCFRL